MSDRTRVPNARSGRPEARLADPDYDHRDFRNGVADGADGDPGTPPVDWGEPVNYEAEGSAGTTVAATAGAGV